MRFAADPDKTEAIKPKRGEQPPRITGDGLDQAEDCEGAERNVNGKDDRKFHCANDTGKD